MLSLRLLEGVAIHDDHPCEWSRVRTTPHIAMPEFAGVCPELYFSQSHADRANGVAHVGQSRRGPIGVPTPPKAHILSELELILWYFDLSRLGIDTSAGDFCVDCIPLVFCTPAPQRAVRLYARRRRRCWLFAGDWRRCGCRCRRAQT